MRYIAAALIACFALALIWGGIQLLSVGGSPAYLLFGLIAAVCAVYSALNRAAARWVYAGLILVSIVWALWETGGDGWALIPRLMFTSALGLILLVPGLPHGRSRGSRWTLAAVCLLGLGLPLAILAGEFERTDAAADPAQGAVAANVQAPEARRQWSAFGSGVQGTRFSSLSQLNPGNVGELEQVWSFSLGETNQLGKGGLQVTPIQIGDRLFLCTSFNDIVALDAETGTQIWRHESKADADSVLSAGCRGVAFYSVDEADGGQCAQRIITNTIDARLIAVDARDGQPCEDFGDRGQVNLLTGMGQKYKGYYYQTSAPLVFRDKIVLGGWVTDNQYWGEPSGAIRAFDARTGEFRWALDVGNLDSNQEPAEGETYSLSSPNSWAPMSADLESGLIFAPLGNPTPDYYGGHRRPFDEEFGSSVIAIDAETGRLRWTFQTTHHDLWDYDVASQPTIADVATPQGIRKAVIQPTKRGEVFVLDRLTGKPIRQVTERKVPQGGIVAGERLSPTQPFSTGMPSLAGERLSEERMWGLTPFDHMWCRIKFREARYDGPLTPPGLKPSITSPGYLGGTNWGSASFDEQTGTLVVNVSHVPNYTRIVTRQEADEAGVSAAKPGTEGNFSYLAQEGLPYAAQTGPFLSPLGAPCTQPPFGEVAAIGVADGTLKWKHRLGTAEDSGIGGLKLGLPVMLGTPNIGGPITTGGGLTFIAASQDSNMRAYDTASGRLLWKTQLPAAGHATPMTYLSEKSGRQFVVIAAGGNVWLRSKLGDDIVAFALPQPGSE